MAQDQDASRRETRPDEDQYKQDEEMARKRMDAARGDTGGGGHGSGEGPDHTGHFYGTGADDLRAGSGRGEGARDGGMPTTTHPRGPTTGPDDAKGGLANTDGIPVRESIANPEHTE